MLTRYLESLDTAHSGRHHPARVAAELHIQLLMGRDISLSQTQAMDGAHLLRFATPGGNRAAEKLEYLEFLKFFRSGRIRVHLMPGVETLRKLLANQLAKNVEQDDFHFSAWPEFEKLSRRDRQDYAAQCDAAAESDTELRTGVSSLDERWSVLRNIDKAVGAAARAPSPVIASSSDGFRASLRKLAEAPLFDPGHRLYLLRKLREHEDKADARTPFFHSIEHDKDDLSKEEQRELHDIVNGVYNRVISRSLGANPNTLNESSKAAAELKRPETQMGSIDSIVGSPEVSGADTPDGVLPPPARFRGMSWRTLAEIHANMQDLHTPVPERIALMERLAVVAAQEVVTYEGRPALLFELHPRLPPLVEWGVEQALACGADRVLHTHFTFHGHSPFGNELATLWLATKLSGTLIASLPTAFEYLRARGIEPRKEELISLLEQNPSYPRNEPSHYD